jgi:hypothetical protein
MQRDNYNTYYSINLRRFKVKTKNKFKVFGLGAIASCFGVVGNYFDQNLLLVISAILIVSILPLWFILFFKE